MESELSKVLQNQASWQTKSPRQLSGSDSLVRKLFKYLGAPSKEAIARVNHVKEIKKELDSKAYGLVGTGISPTVYKTIRGIQTMGISSLETVPTDAMTASKAMDIAKSVV